MQLRFSEYLCKYLAPVVILGGQLFAGCAPVEPINPPKESWASGVTGFEKLVGSEKIHKPLLLAFLQRGCKPCERLSRTVLFDQEFIKQTESIEKIAIDLQEGEEEKFLARKFKVATTPTLFLIVPDRQIVRKIELRRNTNERVYYPKPEEAAAYLHRLLKTLENTKPS